MASASDEEDDSLLIRFTPDRPIMDHPLSSPSSSSPSSTASSSSSSLHGHHPSSKSPNPRILSLILQVLVMALAVSLFFIFVAIAALLLLHICVACRALRRRRRRFHRPPDRLEPLSGLSPSALQALPSFIHGAASGAISDCAVCLDGFSEGDRCRLLPRCSHAFHAACVDTWLARVPVCPICRAGVLECVSGLEH